MYACVWGGGGGVVVGVYTSFRSALLSSGFLLVTMNRACTEERVPYAANLVDVRAVVRGVFHCSCDHSSHLLLYTPSISPSPSSRQIGALSQSKERLRESKAQLERDVSALQRSLDELAAEIAAKDADKRRAANDLAALQSMVCSATCLASLGSWMCCPQE